MRHQVRARKLSRKITISCLFATVVFCDPALAQIDPEFLEEGLTCVSHEDLILPPGVPTSGVVGTLGLIAMLILSALALWRWHHVLPRSAQAVAIILVVLLSATTLQAVHKMTPKGTPIEHVDKAELNAESVEFVQGLVDLVQGDREEILPPTSDFNCHGKSFDDSEDWVVNPDAIIASDYNEVAGNAQLGDIVVYKKNGSTTHSGVVTGIDAMGKVVEVCSKWGPGGSYVHKPDEVPSGEMGNVGGMPVTNADYGSFTVHRPKP